MELHDRLLENVVAHFVEALYQARLLLMNPDIEAL
jgi:hypothetical protein